MDSLNDRYQEDVFTPYLDLLKAQYRFHPKFSYAKQMWEKNLTWKELVNGPYLEKSQTYATGESLEDLSLHESTINTIQNKLSGRPLWKHQAVSIKLLLSGENAVIATGTSSGKTLCFQIPILDDLIRDPSPGLRAIIIYPLNALVNDQLEEWETILKEHKQITFARFTGQTPKSQEKYEDRLKETFKRQLEGEQLSDKENEREAKERLKEKLEKDRKEIPNRLNHREDIRANPPHILITNFSMLEYLLVRPIDVPIFENSNLKFVVLDEAHAYRGVQATEIAFLIRRLKDRLGIENLTCIATSATLGKPGDEKSALKVRKFASSLFGEKFHEHNPIYGTPAETEETRPKEPSFSPTAIQYINAAESLRVDLQGDVHQHLGLDAHLPLLPTLLEHDENLYRLRNTILTKPTLLSDAAKKLWPNDSKSVAGLQALLEIAAIAKKSGSHEDLLPTRLHYFVRSQDGLHVCLHKQCPRRHDGKPAFFVSRKPNANTPEGYCPECYQIGQESKLVELVTCRKCGYLYGALQDLGPRRAQDPEKNDKTSNPDFDSFSTELGWAADSFWSYFSVEDEFPFPPQPKVDEDDDIDIDNLFLHPAELEWCVVCGKKKDEGAGDNCKCSEPHLRKINVFHRQCPNFGKAKDRENLYKSEKKSLNHCPNCGARNASGLEPVQRFQESDDETGLAMAIPLSHFQVSSNSRMDRTRKLLCFTDHRQRAAAFPALLEDYTFAHDMGRMIVKIVNEKSELSLTDLGEHLAELVDPKSDEYDSGFFMPSSRYPDDEELNKKLVRNLWIAETMSYFGIPDSARESAEDLGLVSVKYLVTDNEINEFHNLLRRHSISREDSYATLQMLLGFMRHRKAFTLPSGVRNDDTAFGRVYADIAFALRRDGSKNIGWLPRLNKDGGYRDNIITDYLRRLTKLSSDDTYELAENIWHFLTDQNILIEHSGSWKLDHEQLRVMKLDPSSRYVCGRCGIVTAYSANRCCPRKGCDGKLEVQPFNLNEENIISHWVAGDDKVSFRTLKSEEHTAQINKDLAKLIEDDFRAGEGVNLLSSTTTFEMGINIGDLQKVLLRNAPPSSASYVQRVGRAGRGEDKNSICVTLCRRTKYDADAWGDPVRLMSGEIKTPTVFIQNRVISQRHFNAVVFAKFLRTKLADERAFGDVKQQIRLEGFLPLDARKNIPSKWTTTDKYVDFTEWVRKQDESDILRTEAGFSLRPYDSTFESDKEEAIEYYNIVLDRISGELKALLEERRKLLYEGADKSAIDIGQSVNNLLKSDIINVLAKNGFLPRYAFPLDVVTLETGRTRWSSSKDVELSRDRGIAIAEFAPGSQVIAHKKIFTSAGLYVMSRTDKPDKRWYYRCTNCNQIRTARTKEELKGKCPICQKSVRIKPFIEPQAFSVRIDKRGRGTERHRRSRLIRQRQSLTHFIDSISEEEFQDKGKFYVALKESGQLFRYNLGPENRGFMLCPSCGCSEPMRSFKAGKKHKRLRPFSGTMDCTAHPWLNVAYGHQFQSFCLIARPLIPPTSVESLAFALQKSLCDLLEIDSFDIGVSWRWLDNKRNEMSDVEIILYDTTPGGAGFAEEGYDNWPEVLEKALEICEKCTCENACYDCLKNYGNQSHHEVLDRNSVIKFLKL
jgi:ATP-dependent helicase YprA (DUF1998 family)